MDLPRADIGETSPRLGEAGQAGAVLCGSARQGLPDSKGQSGPCRAEDPCQLFPAEYRMSCSSLGRQKSRDVTHRTLGRQ